LLSKPHTFTILLSLALTLFWVTGMATLCCGQTPDGDTPGIRVSQKALVPFIKQHCLRCHNKDDQNGDFRIDTVAWSINKDAQAEKWQEILDVLNSGEMPPESEPRPKKKKLIEILGTLTGTLDRARTFLSDAGTAVPIRRINRREYINTMRHLFGLNLSEFSIPEDIRGDHFDTLGESQFFDIAAFDKYLELGTQIAQEGIRWSVRPYDKAKTVRMEPEEKNRDRLKGVQGYYDQPRAKEGRYLLTANRRARSIPFEIGDDPRASYRIRFHAGLAKDAHPLRRSIAVSETSGVLGLSGTLHGTLRVRGTVDKPKTEEIIVAKRALS